MLEKAFAERGFNIEIVLLMDRPEVFRKRRAAPIGQPDAPVLLAGRGQGQGFGEVLKAKARAGRFNAGGEPHADFLQCGRKHSVLVGEIMGKGPGRDARRPGDVCELHAVEAGC